MQEPEKVTSSDTLFQRKWSATNERRLDSLEELLQKVLHEVQALREELRKKGSEQHMSP
jgi:hypothetical protein